MLRAPRYRLSREQFLPRPVPDVFAFFADAANLQAITPDFLDFRIVTPLPVAMGEGALIDYRLALCGVPFAWRTRIEQWEPCVRFTDRQLRGPYALWHHTHAFRAAPGGTLMMDVVDYALPLHLLGRAAHAVFVRRTLARIFDHRARRIAELLGGNAALPGSGAASSAVTPAAAAAGTQP